MEGFFLLSPFPLIRLQIVIGDRPVYCQVR